LRKIIIKMKKRREKGRGEGGKRGSG